jgi:hypothetical protein
MLLALEGVGFVEGDVIATLAERAQDAAIIGRGTVPIRG